MIWLGEKLGHNSNNTDLFLPEYPCISTKRVKHKWVKFIVMAENYDCIISLSDAERGRRTESTSETEIESTSET